jgi:hypothetical protein
MHGEEPATCRCRRQGVVEPDKGRREVGTHRHRLQAEVVQHVTGTLVARAHHLVIVTAAGRAATGPNGPTGGGGDFRLYPSSRGRRMLMA